MKKILVISWFYPPINSSEGLVTFKLINNSKYRYDVFTQKSVEDWTYGKNVTFENNENINVIFSKSKGITEWVSEAVNYFKANKDKYIAIMTRAMPHECHLVGIQIKKIDPNIKWIASFGDPISGNPYHHINCSIYSKHSLKNLINKDKGKRYKLSPYRIVYDMIWEMRHKDARRLRRELEYIQNETLKKADKIILNNNSQKDYMFRKNQQYLYKATIIRHSYESSFYNNIKVRERDKKRFVFVGHLDEIRNITPLLHAINSLKKSDERLCEKVEFSFYGDMAAQDKLFIIDNQLYDVVKKENAISYRQSLYEMINADWLIHTDGNIVSIVPENIFFAAKIVDYFGSGTNIFAITMQSGDVVDVLAKSNALISSYSYTEIRNWLYLIIYENYSLKPNKEYIKNEFSSQNVARVFDVEIESLLK